MNTDDIVEYVLINFEVPLEVKMKGTKTVSFYDNVTGYGLSFYLLNPFIGYLKIEATYPQSKDPVVFVTGTLKALDLMFNSHHKLDFINHLKILSGVT